MAAAHQIDLRTLYRDPQRPIRPEDQEFRFTALRPDLGDISVDALVETAEWRDEGADDLINLRPVLRGSMSLRKPHPEQRGAAITIKDGHRFLCEVRWGDRFTPLWMMRVVEPSLNETGGWTFELADDMWQIAQTRATYRYRRGKVKKKRGWRYDEIVIDIARRTHIPAVKLVRGRRRIKNYSKPDTSPLEAIRAAVALEATWTGRPLVMRWGWIPEQKKFGLIVEPLRRNPFLYELREQITGFTSSVARRATMATALTVRGYVKRKGGRRKKHVVRVKDDDAIKQYGFIHKQISVKGYADDRDELVERAKRELAKRLKPIKTVEVTHPGIAYIRRGDAIVVGLPEEGYTGKRSVVFVNSATHRVSSGEYTMVLGLSFIDMIDAARTRAEKERKLREQKRRKS